MAQATRRLTAILSADVAGYSRLMGDDEPGTMAALAECQSVFRRLCDATNGRIVDTAGDSVLGVFDSVADAVLCAMAAQKSLAEWNDPRPSQRRMLFRVGVHLGDVFVHPDGRVFGDGGTRWRVCLRGSAYGGWHQDPGGVRRARRTTAEEHRGPHQRIPGPVHRGRGASRSRPGARSNATQPGALGSRVRQPPHAAARRPGGSRGPHRGQRPPPGRVRARSSLPGAFTRKAAGFGDRSSSSIAPRSRRTSSKPSCSVR